MFFTTPDSSSGRKGVRHQYTQSSLKTEVKQVARDQNIRPGVLLPGGVGDIPAPDYPADGSKFWKLPHLPDLDPQLGKKPDSFGPDEQPKIAIVGAGCSGLFLGLMIDFLHDKIPEFNLKYDIFEAAGDERVGGRLFTYNFPPGEKPGPHEYYDVGGMRFPQNPVMERVFDLFNYLKLPRVDQLTRDTPDGTLIPYSMTNKDKSNSQNEPFRFNDITCWGKYTNIAAQAKDADPFNFNSDEQDSAVDKIPVEVLKAAPGTLVDFAIKELRDALKQDDVDQGSRGWDKLMEYDRYTTRQWLASDQQHLSKYVESCGEKKLIDYPLPPFNANTINFLETMNGGTDWYDQAFSETVLESLDFDYGDDWNKCKRNDYPWWCIMGGAQQLPIIMEKGLSSKPRYKSPVVAIRNTGLGAPYPMEIDVKPTPSSKPETMGYSAVFNTTTLGCLRRIDTTGCRDISTPTKVAMRTLAYGQSCKVGIKFSKAWWKFSLPEDRRILSGGLGHSDMHIRTVVYPSYNILAEEDEPAVLLVSYTWQQDAERIGALISRSSPENEEELKLLLLRELARLHATSPEEEASLYEIISGSYLDHYAHDWSTDPNTAGAFAFFRAQQFSTLWPKIITPSGDLVITGEAASPHHAWVVGAIESSVVGLYSWLYSRAFDIPGAIKALRLIDGTDTLPAAEDGDDSKIPFLGLPDYMPKKYAQWLGLVALDRREKNQQTMN